MKSALPLTLCLCLLACAGPVSAQEPSPVASTIAPDGASRNVQKADLRAVEGRHVSQKGSGRVEERKGWLVLDPEARQLRFEVDRQAFAVAYDRITALHYEKSQEASKWGWPLKDEKHYMIVHYADPEGKAAYETVTVSRRDVSWVLDRLERDTGLAIDRTLARRSFLGIPMRATIGDQVVVTDEIGNALEGTITELSTSALAVEGSTGTRHVFDGQSVNTIKRTRSRGRDALRGFAIGAITGAIAGGLAGYGIAGDAISVFQGAAVMGAFTGGIGALASAVAPSYRQRATRDIYQKP